MLKLLVQGAHLRTTPDGFTSKRPTLAAGKSQGDGTKPEPVKTHVPFQNEVNTAA